MTQLFKKLVLFLALTIAIIGCSDPRDQARISELQGRVDSCLALNNQQYNEMSQQFYKLKHVCVNSGLVAQISAYQDSYPVANWLIIMTIMGLAGAMIWALLGLGLDNVHNYFYKNYKSKIKTLKAEENDLLQSIQKHANKVRQEQTKISALTAQKTALLNEIEDLQQYQNIDELKEKAKIIETAKAKADDYYNQKIDDINNRVAEETAKLKNERQLVAEERAELEAEKERVKVIADEVEIARRTIMGG